MPMPLYWMARAGQEVCERGKGEVVFAMGSIVKKGSYSLNTQKDISNFKGESHYTK